MNQTFNYNKKREKPILSCLYCRSRKQSPCGTCDRHGKRLECTYLTSETERKNAVDYRPHAKISLTRQRIHRLENFVNEMQATAHVSLSAAGSGAKSRDHRTSSEVPSQGQVEGNLGRLSVTDHHTVFTGNTHWATILEDIQGLKDDLADDESDSSFVDDSAVVATGPSQGTRFSLLTSASCISRADIMGTVPERKLVDRHVSQFFNTYDWAPFILNRKAFLDEYTKFWSDPSATSITWIGLLFGLMNMSIILQQRDAEALGLSTAETQSTLEMYRTMTIHCLITGDYLRPGRHTIGALTLHFAVEQALNVDPDIGNWLLIGLIIRIALRAGLHRDPSHWPRIKPLHAELRRRMWMTLYQMDFFTSTQLGLPRIIKDSQCDTRPPLHLLDSDISFNDEHAPPERSHTYPTALSFIIQRNNIIKVAAEIYDASEATILSDMEIDALGTKVGQAAAALPDWLRYTTMETSIADDPVIILQRIFVDILIRKALYLLHRRSFARRQKQEMNGESNRLCIEAALTILEHQRRIDEETRPGGLMFGIRWKVANSLNHEFLQATMMLCLALTRFDDSLSTLDDDKSKTLRLSIIEALSGAKELWDKIVKQSDEARGAVKAISRVLRLETETSSDLQMSAELGDLDFATHARDFSSETGLGAVFSLHPGQFDDFSFDFTMADMVSIPMDDEGLL